jgi:ribonucleoside-diphosphate reductase beta chain
MQKSFQVGSKTFILDQAKAEAAFADKKVINGRESMAFNLLPLKYQWAYDLYRTMKANHWEPEDIPMGKDIEQWRDEKAVNEIERWIIRMGIGYFSAAEGIVGDNIQHVVRELVTAPELKLVLGRHAHEENIHADSLLYMISSLGINPHECEAMFEDIPTIARKNEFAISTSPSPKTSSSSPRTSSFSASAWRARSSTACSA